jgi:hypothetical protein
VRGGRLVVALVVSGAVLALGLAGLAWTLTAGSSQAQQGAMHNCPSSGKWSIAVWEGDDATSIDQALATCGEDTVAAAYGYDGETQEWSRWFADQSAVSDLSTLDNMEGVLALGASTTTQTPSLPAGWTKIEPGGETICSTGTPYAFYVHPGAVNRLVVYFEGGGACWDENTCSNPGLYYDDSVDDTEDNPANHQQGMADLDNPENPFKDWFQVFVPYCTGDIHWGTQTTTYHWGGADHTINHKGFVNVSAVLDWIQTNFAEPEKLFVTGCSAGAYGSVMGAAYLHQLYPDVPLYQLGDAGAGVITESFFQGGFPNWGAEQTIPDWIPALQIPWQELTMANLYIAGANYYPNDRFAQYNTAHDEDQTFFYQAMQGTGDWGQLMMASIDEIQDATTNFEAYTAPGEIHCITPLDIFYTREVNGVKFVDWLDAMVNDQPWDSATCTDCETDPEAQ